MQRFFIIILFISVPFLGIAQSKPSKEETIKFMTSILKKSEYVDGADHERQFIDFSGDILKWRITCCDVTLENIDWSSYNSFNFNIINDELIEISILFDNLFKRTSFFLDLELPKSWSSNKITWYLPLDSKNKLESFKKACLRLKEIWQEENKDPFAN